MANSSVTFALALRAAVRESVPAAIAVVTSMIKTLAGIPAHEVVRPGEDEPDEGHVERSSGDWTLDEFYDSHGFTSPMEIRLSGVLLGQAWEWNSWVLGVYFETGTPLPIDVGEVTSEIVKYEPPAFPVHLYVDHGAVNMLCGTSFMNRARENFYGTANTPEGLKTLVEEAIEKGMTIYGPLRERELTELVRAFVKKL